MHGGPCGPRDTRYAQAHAAAAGLVHPPIDQSVERWCDYLVATRFGAPPARAERDSTRAHARAPTDSRTAQP